MNGQVTCGQTDGWMDGPAAGVSDSHSGRERGTVRHTSSLKDGWESWQMVGGGKDGWMSGRADGNTVGCNR